MSKSLCCGGSGARRGGRAGDDQNTGTQEVSGKRYCASASARSVGKKINFKGKELSRPGTERRFF